MRRMMENDDHQVYKVNLPHPVYAEREFIKVDAFRGEGDWKVIQITLRMREVKACLDDVIV
jgi:hypothetical protein